MSRAGLTSTLVQAPADVARAAGGLATGALRHPVAAARALAAFPGRARPLLDIPHRHRRTWETSGRIHIELREVATDGAGEYAKAVVAALEETPGVHWADVLGMTGRVVVAHDGRYSTPERLVEVVDAVESDLDLEDASLGLHRPDHAADVQPLARGAIAIGADLGGIGLASVGRAMHLPTPPVEIDAAALMAVASYVPFLRDRLDRWMTSGVSELSLAVARAATSGLAQGITGPAIDVLHRGSLMTAAEARRRAWNRRESALCEEPSRLEVDAMLRPIRRYPLPEGPIEKYSRRTWLAAMGGGTAAGLVTRSVDRTLQVLIAGIPKAARWGREAFVAQLGRNLAARDVVIQDPRVLELLDRVDVLVIEGGLLVQGVHRAPYLAETLAAARGAEVSIWAAADEPLPQGVTVDGKVAIRDAPQAIDRMQSEGRVVMAVAFGPAPMLTAADIGVGLHREGVPPWNASLIAGDDLLDVYVMMQAVGVAKHAARQSAHIALAGAGAGSLFTIGGLIPGGTARVMNTTNLAALVAHLNGTRHGISLARDPLPTRPDTMAYHAMSIDGVVGVLGSRRGGLSAEEARARRVVPPRPVPGPLAFARSVGDEMVNPLTPFLAAGAGLSALAGSASDAILVGGVMGLNALVGGAQRYRAERSLARLLQREQQLVTVLRDGKPQSIPDDQLVRGDIVYAVAGDALQADCRIIDAIALEVDESALTGESMPVFKTANPVPGDAPVADRHSMLYAGTTIAAGTATAVVTAVGRATEAYRGLLIVGESGPETGVEARLESLTSLVTPASVLAGVGILANGMLRNQPTADVLGAGVSLAVAAVPEGLPLLATVAQQASARRLSERGVLVRNIRAIEALGRVDIVCADKTGTLTEGKIRVGFISDGGEFVKRKHADERFLEVLAAALRATPEPEEGQRLPHPTDWAMVKAGDKTDTNSDLGAEGWHLESELPFEPSRGYHAALGKTEDGGLLVVKGAPEVVFPLCTHRFMGSGHRRLTPAMRRAITNRVHEMASRGVRVLVVAQRAAPIVDEITPDMVDELTLVGFLGLRDPVRPAAAEAISNLRRAGVDVLMITGDHPDTAMGIADELGIANGVPVVSGIEIDRLDDDALGELLENAAICARVTPAHKTRIVRALQKRGRIVAMTGDGANDAAAIRMAEVGIALGKRATPAARDASDLVVTDDRIETIVSAVVEGRAMWSSVRDATSILVGGNLGEIIFTLAGSLVGGRPPLNARQLLLVNLMTDVAPALAIAVAPPQGLTPEQLLEEGPDRSLGESLNRAIISRAATTALGTGGAWVAGRLTGTQTRASTIALAALVGTELGQTLVTGRRSGLVVVSSAASAALLAAMIQTPGVSQAFGCRPLGPLAWSQVMTAAGLATAGSVVMPGLLDWILDRRQSEQ